MSDPSGSIRAPVARNLRTDILVATLILAFTAAPTQLRSLSSSWLLYTFRLELDPVDLAANVLGYIPLGITLANRHPARALAIAAALSLGAEAMQLFSVGRTAEIIDVASNVVGAGIGFFLSARWRILPKRLTVTPHWALPPP